MGNKRVHFLVEGRVQGVFFRAYTKDTADQLGLTGWVRNLADGRVEGCIEGNESQIQKMLQWLQSGPPRAVVTKLEHYVMSEMENRGEFEILSTAPSPLTDS